VLPAGFAFMLADRAFAEKLAAHFPDSIASRGSRLEVIRPLVLAAPSHAPFAPAPVQTSLVRRVMSAVGSAISGASSGRTSAACSSSAKADSAPISKPSAS
jgi:hypothetical protein